MVRQDGNSKNGTNKEGAYKFMNFLLDAKK